MSCYYLPCIDEVTEAWRGHMTHLRAQRELWDHGGGQVHSAVVLPPPSDRCKDSAVILKAGRESVAVV